MKSRRVLVSIEVETDASLAALKKATLRVTVPCNIRYVEQNRVNTIRASTAKRGKAKKESK